MNERASYPQAYIEFLATYYGSRDFFECHDIMEDYWKEQGASRYAGCWLVFIRLSVACYHARRGNWSGARKMMAKAAEEIDAARMSELGIDGNALALLLRKTAEAWRETVNPVYHDIALPFTDAALEAEGQRICRERGWRWGTPSDQIEADIVHRHLTRDRTAVVEARRLAAARKQATRRRN